MILNTLCQWQLRRQPKGVERFIIDDGWFKRSKMTIKAALGDWFLDERKYPLSHSVVEHVNQLGMEFGLWFEPK